MKVTILLTLLAPILAAPGQALPPPADGPEEILRTEIITGGRSPLTGEPLTPAEYNQLQEQLQQTDVQLVPDNIQHLIFLLQIRRVIKPLVPILP